MNTLQFEVKGTQSCQVITGINLLPNLAEILNEADDDFTATFLNRR